MAHCVVLTPLVVIGSMCLLAAPTAAQQLGPAPDDANDPGAGKYPIPYGILKPETVEADMARIRDYIFSQTRNRIINRKTGEEIIDFSTIHPDAFPDGGRHNEYRLWSYPMGVTYNAMLYAAAATGDDRYREYVRTRVGAFFEHFGYFKTQGEKFGFRGNPTDSLVNTSSLDDCGSMGAAIIKLQMSEPGIDHRWAIDHIANYISTVQFRHEGILARQRPQRVSIWADDMYMCAPFLAQMGHLTGERKYFDDAAHQVLGMFKILFKERTGLYDHGWHAEDGEYDTVFHWSRANGWCVMATAELLNVLPADHPRRGDVLHVFRRHLQGVISYQSANGLWHNLVDKVDSFTETTGTAMFVFGIARGINEGWLPPSWGMAAVAGWEGISTKILPNGQVEGGCWGTTLANDAAYYYARPTSVDNSHSYGPTLMAGAEIIRLLKNEKLQTVWQHRTWHFRPPFDGPLE